MILNTKEPINDLDGNPIDGLTVGNQLANLLIKPDPRRAMKAVKCLVLAQKLHQEDTVNIDEADARDIKQYLETETETSPLIIGTIILALDKKEED